MELLTEAQLENLKKGRDMGRAKAQANSAISRKQTSEIRKYKKEEEKANREAEYQNIIDARKARASKPVEEHIPEPTPEPKKSHHKKPTPTLPPPPPEESSSEEEEEIPEPIPKKTAQKPTPAAQPAAQPVPIQDMYSKANIEMFRHRLYQQTSQRLKNDMFSY